MSSEVAPTVNTDMMTGEPDKTNNFSITFCTINGSGSATANNILLRAFFRMGIPVSGKNIFPSNIQGLPTWYTIRLSRDGYLARVEEDDVVVAMNPATFAKDLARLVPGGAFFYADDIKMPITRDDIAAYPMPVKRLAKEADAPSNMRDYVANMVYVGILAHMLGISMETMYETLDFQFKGKKKAIDSNMAVIKAAVDWAAENLQKKDNYRVAPMNGTEGYIMQDGNVAAALGALFGGVQFVAWYPITPASSLAESINDYLPKLRTNADGKLTCVVVQSEDELAAIGMTVGAGWAGLRSMTSTSGPGLSLMAEYMGLAYYAEVPVVVWDVQRVGPSTGLPTRTAQADLTEVYFLSHGDTQNIILMAGSVSECFEFGWKALDLAERLQTPVVVMSDLDLGMNQWMTKAFEYPETPMDRGKVLWEEGLAKMEQWGRYLDVDKDGIPYRTVLGNQATNAAYFARGTGHDEYARYSEDSETWEKGLARLKLKFKTASQIVPKPEIELVEGAEIALVTMGSADPAVKEARDILAKQGIKTDYMRIRAIPFSPEVEEFLANHKRNYVIELNRDGQLKQLLDIEIPSHCKTLVSVAHTDGLPLTARWVKDQIVSEEAK